MNEHLVQDPSQAAGSSPGREHTLDPVSNSCSLAPSKSSSALSAKLRRQKVKVVTALKSLTNSSSEQPVVVEPLSPPPEKHSPKSTFISGIHKMSNAIFRPPLEPTVVRRTSPKGRPLLKETFQEAGTSPESGSGSSPIHTTAASNTSSSKTSASNSTFIQSAPNSPGKTSTESMFKTKDPNTVGREKRTRFPTQQHRSPPHPRLNTSGRGTPPSSPKGNINNTNLNPIQESPATPGLCSSSCPPQPSIATAERAAAAKIFLETHFNGLLASGPSPRQMRQQMLETELFNRAREHQQQLLQRGGSGRGGGGGMQDAAALRARFWRRESEYLREMRAVKVRGLGVGMGTKVGGGMRTGVGAVGGYETVKVLGKGSFGVVRLVRECHRRGRVYAMKVIRKTKMLRTSQEGHLRAERDLLVASEGSRWIVPLVASFQDLANLYLVMEYMPGGDFLSLLIRENILHESVARFYVAEIILCVEAAHSLKCIHRDIKPDNFLVSASGHLKISDFGLAFDGHWSHDTTYYNSHRSESRGLDAKKRSSGITVGIEKHDKKDLHDGEPLLSWRNRCGTRHAARSVVGTSQYMAPEWSVGVILFECIYGHTPFLAEEGRHQTKENILRHHETFGFPPRPTVSRRCQHLMLSLITDKEYRLCSERYRMKDLITTSSSSSASGAAAKMRDFAGRYVFPYDAEDIKAHKWFRHIPWERLHELEPPLVPKLRAVDDTHYFDDGGSVSDGSESEPEPEAEGQVGGVNDGAAERIPNMLFPSPEYSLQQATTGWSLACYQSPPALTHAHPHPPHPDHCGYFQNYTSTTNEQYSLPPPALPSLESPVTPAHFQPAFPVPVGPPSQQEHLTFLRPLRYPLQTLALTALATPPHDRDSKLHTLDLFLEHVPDATGAERAHLREFVRRFCCAGGGGGGGNGGKGGGRERERRRPRDRLLRDEGTRGVAMEVRRRTAFLGYEWTRMRRDEEEEEGEQGGGVGVGLDGEGGDSPGGGGDEENEVGNDFEEGRAGLGEGHVGGEQGGQAQGRGFVSGGSKTRKDLHR
ncbi:hypothetical protein C8A01DRAFT_44583 [Parachaetomium inaequale]|uniref:non-specific serine/threonine protein kinase n=1 Tax=Parachaetomium inaequale TaxID=2588326 RepID=A0AAN6PKH6_9PEZI|nr:hypothetical protein C8A01DRAFT_44583 [Parachaetomium inaequale]